MKSKNTSYYFTQITNVSASTSTYNMHAHNPQDLFSKAQVVNCLLFFYVAPGTVSTQSSNM